MAEKQVAKIEGSEPTEDAAQKPPGESALQSAQGKEKEGEEKPVDPAEFKDVCRKLRSAQRTINRLSRQAGDYVGVENRLADRELDDRIREIDAAEQKEEITPEIARQRRQELRDNHTKGQVERVRGMIANDGVDLTNPNLAGIKGLLESSQPDAALAAYQVIDRDAFVKDEEPMGDDSGKKTEPARSYSQAEYDAALKAQEQAIFAKYKLTAVDTTIPGGTPGTSSLQPGGPEIEEGLRKLNTQT